jgi:HK97 family phage major capsid protein
MAPVRRRHRRGWGLGLIQAVGFLFAAAMLEVATAPAVETNPEIARLVERQSELATIIRDMDAESKGKALEGDVREKWNESNTEYEANEKLLKELRARMQRVLAVAGKPEGDGRENGMQPFNVQVDKRGDIYDLSTIQSSLANPEGAKRELIERARVALDRDAEFAHPEADQDAAKAQLERNLRGASGSDFKADVLALRMLQTGSLTYRRAFWKSMAGQILNSEEQRALAVGTGVAGAGLAVPYTLDPTIIPTSNGATNPLRAISRIEQITGLEWRGVASGAVTANRRAEAAETTDNAPTLTGPSRQVSRVDVLIPFSLEVELDWPSMESEMAQLIQDAKDEEEADSFFNANGTLPNPQGVLTGTTNTVTAGAGGTFTLANLYSLKGALPPRYVPRARFVSDTLIGDKIRQFDTSGGAGLWTTLGNATPELLLGKPYHEASGMPDVTTVGVKFLLYGDFSRFIIVDRIGLTIETVQHLVTTNHRPTGQRALFAYWFNNAFVADANGFRALLGAA